MSLAALFLILNRLEWATAIAVGIGNAAAAGFYPDCSGCKKK